MLRGLHFNSCCTIIGVAYAKERDRFSTNSKSNSWKSKTDRQIIQQKEAGVFGLKLIKVANAN